MHFAGEGPLSNPCLTWVLLPFLYCRGKSSLLSWRKFPVLSTPLPSLLFLRRHVVRTVMKSHLICSRSTTVYFKIILVLNQAYFNIQCNNIVGVTRVHWRICSRGVVQYIQRREAPRDMLLNPEGVYSPIRIIWQ